MLKHKKRANHLRTRQNSSIVVYQVYPTINEHRFIPSQKYITPNKNILGTHHTMR